LLGYTANLVWSAVGGLVYLALPGTDAAKAGVDGPSGG